MDQAEKEVAQKAEQMLTAALRNTVSSLGFVEHVSGGTQRISDAQGVSQGKEGTAQEGGNRYYMNRLALRMPIHGYVQNFGDHGIRRDHMVNRKKPRATTYEIRAHEWNLPEKDFIKKAIDGSGVVNYVMENIARIRSEDIILYLKYYFENSKMT